MISNSSFYRCLCNCPHYPPQPQLVWLMPLRRKEHMHQRAGAHISFESASIEIRNASVCQPVYFACGLCRCIIIYLLQQNSDSTSLFDPFLLVRSVRTCISPPLNPVSDIGHTHSHSRTFAHRAAKCQLFVLNAQGNMQTRKACNVRGMDFGSLLLRYTVSCSSSISSAGEKDEHA